jgi:hypothetical protein
LAAIEKQPLMKHLILIACSLFTLSFTMYKKNKVIKQTYEKTHTEYLKDGDYLKFVLNNNRPYSDKVKKYSKSGLLTKLEILRNEEVVVSVNITNNKDRKFETQEHFNKYGELTKKVIRESDSLTISYDREMNKVSQNIELELNDFESISKTTDFRNNTFSQSLIRRDSNKNVIHVQNEIVFNNDTIKGETFYKYEELDERGNWTKSLASKSMKFDTVKETTRNIDYY